MNPTPGCSLAILTNAPATGSPEALFTTPLTLGLWACNGERLATVTAKATMITALLLPFAESIRLNMTSLLPAGLLPASLIALRDRMDPQDDASTHDVQILLIGAAKAAVLRRFIVRHFNVCQVLAFRIEHLNSRGRRSVPVALAVL